MSTRDELITARDKLHAAARLLDHAVARRLDIDDAIDGADALMEAARGHLHFNEEDHEHGG